MNRRAEHPDHPRLAGISSRLVRLAMLAAGVAALAWTLCPSGVSAQRLVYGIESFEAELAMDEAGAFEVVERIRFRVEAGSFSEGYRRIPLDRRTEVVSVEVSSPDTGIERVRERRSGGDLVLEWSFERRTASATFEIRYRVTGALLEVDGENRIDWEPVGTDWEVPLERVRVAASWPDLGLERGDIRIAPADGGTLSRTERGWEVVFEPDPLDAGQSWAMAVGFPGRIEGRSPPAPVNRGALALGLVGALLAGLLPVAAVERGTRPPAVSAPRSIPSPPEVPLHRAVLLAHGAMYWAPRVFPALLVSLARRGHVTLLREPVEEGGTGERLRVIRAPDADAGGAATGAMTPFEARFLAEVEGHDDFGAFLTGAGAFHRSSRAEALAELEAGGWMVDRKGRSVRLIGLGVGVLLAGIGALVGVAGTFGLPAHLAVPWLLFVVLLGVGLMLAGTRRHDLTLQGARERAEVRAWQAALRAEIERKVERDPEGAGWQLVEQLEWLLADPSADAAWMGRIERRLRDAGLELALPEWLRSRGGPLGGTDDDFLAVFLPIYLLTVMSTPGSGAGASGMPGTGFPSGGVGATGSFGGGGGGIR